tara:strand:+ start:793 stop:948 length:156 start_codon:yes stop_codon:yes gene_type:complete
MISTQQALINEMKSLIADLQVQIAELTVGRQNNIDELLRQIEQLENKEYDI